MDRNASRFANRHESRNHRIGVTVLKGNHLPLVVGRDAAHVVVNSRDDRDRFTGDIDTRKDTCRLCDARQPFLDHGLAEVFQVQVGMILFQPDPASFTDFNGN